MAGLIGRLARTTSLFGLAVRDRANRSTSSIFDHVWPLSMAGSALILSRSRPWSESEIRGARDLRGCFAEPACRTKLVLEFLSNQIVDSIQSGYARNLIVP